MYEFSFPEIAKYSASEIYENILYLETTLSNEPQNENIILQPDTVIFALIIFIGVGFVAGSYKKETV